jgi:hypothetical protein
MGGRRVESQADAGVPAAERCCEQDPPGRKSQVPKSKEIRNRSIILKYRYLPRTQPYVVTTFSNNALIYVSLSSL